MMMIDDIRWFNTQFKIMKLCHVPKDYIQMSLIRFACKMNEKIEIEHETLNESFIHVWIEN